MIILGAGMSGMLAGHYFRHMNPTIIEKQGSLPNNHKALLRFRSNDVAQLSGIPFKQVSVSKMINYKEQHITEPNLFLNNLYSQKTNGSLRSRSLMNLDQCERYVAPEDFIQKLSYGLDILFGKDAGDAVGAQMIDKDPAMISTMPVHVLADMLDYDLGVELEAKKIWTLSFDLPEFLDCDVYQTLYYPNPLMPLYRMSITGGKVIAEFCECPESKWGTIQLITKNILHFLSIDFGIDLIINDTVIPTFENLELKEQKYGKLVPCNGNEVREFLGWATHEHNIYSLGRWGTHRQLLMDDVVKDLGVISNMIRNNRYKA